MGRQVWNGFDCEDFCFEGQEAVIVFPKEGTAVGRLALKTEYWGAYPDVEIRLLQHGFHLAYIKNRTRFATQDDCDRKARFVAYLAEKYALSEKCVPIGMSCGGAHAVRFAGFHPEHTACLFIDAPVLNYSSFPGKLGNAEYERVWETEFVRAYPEVKRYQLCGFDAHPMNMADVLVRHGIPVLMVYGTEDLTVPYEENGRLFEEAFAGTDLLETIRVPLRGHHPHGMIGSNEPIVNYILAHCGL